eukprot:5838188-Prymnesium_polylepis.1
MTGAFCMVRDTSRDAWELSDHATKLASPVGIAGLNVKGLHRTFHSGAAGVKMAISSSGAIKA